MSATNSPSWPPGWYEDKGRPGRGRRYWDGKAWTDRFELPEPEDRSAFCEECGTPMRATAKFCPRCGHTQSPQPDNGRSVEQPKPSTGAAPNAGTGTAEEAATARPRVAIQPDASPQEPSAGQEAAAAVVHGPTGITAKTRATLALSATTSLPPETALTLVEDVATLVKGGGMSLLTAGLANIGAQVNVERRSDSSLSFSITSGQRLVELCTFSASVEPAGTGTSLRVGGLETYKTSQDRILGFVPASPKAILGFAPYKRFLNLIATALAERDPQVQVSIAVPTPST